MLTPLDDVAVARGSTVELTWTASDPDGTALTWVLADADGDETTEDDQIELAGPLLAHTGETERFEVATGDEGGLSDGTWSLLVLCSDFASEAVVVAAPGRLTVEDRSFSRSVSGPSGEARDANVAACPDGGFLAVGSLTGTLLLDPGEPQETRLASVEFVPGPLLTPQANAYVVRRASDGTVLWARQPAPGAPASVVGPGGTFPPLAGYACDASVLVATDDGGAVVGGRLQGPATFGAGEPNETSLEGTAFQGSRWIARYDGSGRLVWARLVPLPVASVACTSDSVTVLATLAGEVTLDLGLPSETTIHCRSVTTTGFFFNGTGNLVPFTTVGPASDLALIRLDPAGSVLSAVTFGPSIGFQVSVAAARGTAVGSTLVRPAYSNVLAPPGAVAITQTVDPTEPYFVSVGPNLPGLLSVDAAGVLLWSRVFSGEGSIAPVNAPTADGGAIHVASASQALAVGSIDGRFAFVGPGLFVLDLGPDGLPTSVVGEMGDPVNGGPGASAVEEVPTGGWLMSTSYFNLFPGVFGRFGGIRETFPGNRTLLLRFSAEGDLLWATEEAVDDPFVVFEDGTFLRWTRFVGPRYERRNADGSGS